MIADRRLAEPAPPGQLLVFEGSELKAQSFL